MKAVWVALLAAATTGCMSTSWSRKDSTSEQAQEDLHACEDAAYKEANAVPFPYPTMGPVILQDSSGRQFNVYPVGPFADPQGDRYARETRLARECMRKKGYELVAPARK